MAIEFGMTSEEFWKDDPKLFSSYQKAYIEQQKRDNEQQNYSNWLQGLYIYDGLQKSLTDFGYGFLAGKRNSERETYPERPYDLFGNESKRRIEQKEIARKKNQKNLNFWATIKK